MSDLVSVVHRARGFVLLIAGIGMGTILFAPARAHFLPDLAHLTRHMKKAFHPRGEADARFVNVDERAADSELLDGLDSSAFLAAGGKAADSELLDGLDSTALARKLGNVLTVSFSGGDFESVQAAIDSAAAGVENPYLVIVGPGTYDGRVTLRPGITLRGSGRDATILRAGGAESCQDAFVVRGSFGATVGSLRVLNDGGSSCAVAALNGFGESTTYRDVVLRAEGATNTSIGLFNDGAGLVRLEDAVVEAFTPPSASDATAIGVDHNGLLAWVRRSEVTATSEGAASYGIRHNGGASSVVEASLVQAGGSAAQRIAIFTINAAEFGNVVSLERSTAVALTNTVLSAEGYEVKVSFSRLDGGPVGGAGTTKCAAVVNEAHTFSASTCP